MSIPQDVELPAWAYQRVSGPRVNAHDGGAGIASGRMQITCQAESYSECKDLAEAIRRSVIGFRGEMGTSSSGAGVRVFGCQVENEIDGYGMTGGVYTVRMDVVIIYQEI